MVVYGFVANNLDAAANTATITVDNQTAPRVGPKFVVPLSIAGSSSLVLPNGPRPYFRDETDTEPPSLNTDTEFLDVQLTNATLMSFVIIYRCE
jgi:hypothetical protein